MESLKFLLMSNALVLVRSYTLQWFSSGLARTFRYQDVFSLLKYIYVFASALVCFNFKSLCRCRVEGAIFPSASFRSENICLSYTRIMFCVYNTLWEELFEPFGCLKVVNRGRAVDNV